MRRYTLGEVEAILVIDDFARVYDLYKDGTNIFDLYEEFCHSKYNIPYRDINFCVKAWIDSKKMEIGDNGIHG